jgi:hypothetical protein
VICITFALHRWCQLRMASRPVTGVCNRSGQCLRCAVGLC